LKFKDAYKAWVHCEPFNFGPADETVMLQSAINYWPTKPSLINTELSGSGEISSSYVEGLGAEKKGFPALAYLLFNIKDGNTAVLNTFTADGSQRRKQYVNALAENIAANVITVRDAWKNGYAATFKTNTGTSLNSSLSLLLNNLVIDLETSKNKRIGIPIGRKDNFTQGPVDPDAVELPYTDFAKEMLLETADAMDNLFQGKGSVGFDDYVAVLKVQSGSTTLEESIKTEFATFKNEIGDINSPMQNTITTDPSAINTAWVQSKKLLVLLKVDLASNLGILITFSDNDGD
jgi:predicted lipoprotein